MKIQTTKDYVLVYVQKKESNIISNEIDPKTTKFIVIAGNEDYKELDEVILNFNAINPIVFHKEQQEYFEKLLGIEKSEEKHIMWSIHVGSIFAKVL